VRLVSFTAGGSSRAGLCVGERIVDLGGEPALPSSVLEMLQQWPQMQPLLGGLARADTSTLTSYAVHEVQINAPFEPPRIMGTGANYREHIQEFKVSAPPDPSAFLKLPGTATGPGDVVIEADMRHVDYEGEIAIVLGSHARNIAASDASAVIAGVMLANDLSSRDVSTCHSVLGKGYAGFCPLGPALVTLDEVDLAEIEFTVSVNGEIRQRADIRTMVHSFANVVASFSRALPLEPGDVILTGTPAGVGIGMTPPRFLEHGDIITIDSPQLGVLTTRIVMSAP
jgi:2-keto-4-pentenoate hydratase/2-oxohepta-3-ene-1,7-dioic acid hydratase in catechol pathway